MLDLTHRGIGGEPWGLIGVDIAAIGFSEPARRRKDGDGLPCLILRSPAAYAMTRAGWNTAFVWNSIAGASAAEALDASRPGVENMLTLPG